MISIKENFDLHSLNTFHVRAKARYFCEVESVEQFKYLLDSRLHDDQPWLVLGGGSNILFTRDFAGLVIQNAVSGHEVVDEDDNHVWLKGGSGNVWHEVVMFALSHDWGGIENLSLIPGTLGAAPIQNIGAYGVELQDVLHEVEFVDFDNGGVTVLNREQCLFGYRDSIFKRDLQKKIFISSVTLRLTKKDHKLFTHYGSINDVLTQQKISSPTIQDVSKAVISIRKSKLPDPAQIGNAGSFFKNPTITYDRYMNLQKLFSKVPGYPIDSQFIKIPAGWLIEQCGWKGKRINSIGVHEHQALVLVNYGDGRGEEISELAKDIQESVRAKFEIELMPEVNII